MRPRSNARRSPSRDQCPSRRATQRRRILAYLRTCGDHTVDELTRLLRMPVQTVSARCAELRRTRQVRRTGARRRTRLGCLAHVLAARVRVAATTAQTGRPNRSRRSR